MRCLYAGGHADAQALLRRAIATGDAMDGLRRSHVSVVAEMAARAYLVWSRADCGLFEEAAGLGGEAIHGSQRTTTARSTPSSPGHAGQGPRRQGPVRWRDPAARARTGRGARELTLLTTAVLAPLGYAYARSHRLGDVVAIQIRAMPESAWMRAFNPGPS
jgi:hypothetical protein